MFAEHHILVVDDAAAIRDAVALILEPDGYTVKGPANDREALDHLRDGPLPCLILLDLMMPVMDGWQFREEQLRDRLLAYVPVVVMSAVHDARDNATKLGAMDCLQKPLRSGELLALVQRLC